MRHWLLTNTTYGTWLPGDARGSVTSVRDIRPGESRHDTRIEHDIPGEAYEDEIAGLEHSAKKLLKGPPIHFDRARAEHVLDQFQETSQHRGWTLLAASIMLNHFHIVVRVEGDPDPRKVLVDFKAYASRRLNRLYGKPKSETWWTTKGSKRKLSDAQAVADAINYVVNKQPNPLVTWSAENGEPEA